ncbi:MAG TPA: ABC transporter substrate-binding protein [Methanotrichaceae archaeon]|nr:ABC transporter substrate-binding protein [Methanotrichaceae archaeon]
MLDEKRKLMIAAAIVVVVLSIGASVYAQNTKADDVVIRASVNKDCSGTPWFAGVEKGFFKNAGVNFEDIGQIAYPQRAAAFASGQMDVFDEHPSTLINLIKAGAPIIGVAQSGDEPVDGDLSKMHMHWLVRDDSPIKTVADIAKQDRPVKIGTLALGICVDTEDNALLRKNNIPKDKIEYVVLPDPEQIQALKQGLIDVAILHPPFFTAAESQGGVRVLATSTDAFGSAGGTSLLFFTKDFIKNHPDAVRKFIKAYKATEQWANTHRDEAGALTAKDIGLDKSTVHYYSNSGKVNDAQLQYWIDSLVADGVIKKGEFKPKDLYTDEFKDVW